MEYKLDPKKHDMPEFEGCVVVRSPTFDEKYEAIELCNLEFDEKGEVKTNMKANIGAMRKLVSFSERIYKEVKLKHKDGTEYKSFEELCSDPDRTQKLLTEVATMIMSGFKPSKNSKPS